MNNFDGLYNKDYYGERLYEDHFSDKKLYFRIIENGTILPHKGFRVNGNWNWGFGGIVDAKGNFVKSSFIVDGAGYPYTPEEEIETNPATVIYLGMFFGVWGHCISDSLRHLWFLKSNVFNEYFKSCPIVCLNWNNDRGGGILPNFAKLLNILGIDLNRLIFIDRPIKFQTIILPDGSFTGGKFTKEYVENIEQIRHYAKKIATPLQQKKIFYHYGYDTNFGENRLAEYFQSKGYAIVHPGDLPLEDQLNILANCENFASTEGSCSHNSVFLKDNAEVLLIPRSSTRLPTVHQLIMNQIRNDCNVFYVDSALSLFATQAHGPFCYIISEQLRKFFGEEITEKFTAEDFEIFLQYLKYSLQQGFTASAAANGYYSIIMPEFYSQLQQQKDLLEKYNVKLN